ncbi:MAG: hypothetical protein V1814_03435 [Candidatus Moraniibacteriota bacterium]
MEKPEKLLNKTDPRIIEDKFYQNPIKICYKIDEIIFRLLADRSQLSKKIDSLSLEILELSGEVKDAFYVKDKNPNSTVETGRIINLADALKKLIAEDEFLGFADSLYIKEDASQDYLTYKEPLPVEIKTKNDLKNLIEKYISLLNYFALDNYSTRGKMRH